MVLRSMAKQNSNVQLAKICRLRKSEVNNKTLNPTPHVPTETGGAAINAVEPKPVSCVVPKPRSSLPLRAVSDFRYHFFDRLMCVSGSAKKERAKHKIN